MEDMGDYGYTLFRTIPKKDFPLSSRHLIIYTSVWGNLAVCFCKDKGLNPLPMFQAWAIPKKRMKRFYLEKKYY